MPVWRGMNFAELDTAYNNMAAVPMAPPAFRIGRAKPSAATAVSGSTRPAVWQPAAQQDRPVPDEQIGRAASGLHPWWLLAAELQGDIRLHGGGTACPWFQRGDHRLHPGTRYDLDRNCSGDPQRCRLAPHGRTGARCLACPPDRFRLVGGRTSGRADDGHAGGRCRLLHQRHTSIWSRSASAVSTKSSISHRPRRKPEARSGTSRHRPRR